MSVRQTESLVRIIKNGQPKRGTLRNSNIISTENELSEKIGMRVHLINKKDNSGTLTFTYKGLDQLDRLIKVIKINY